MNYEELDILVLKGLVSNKKHALDFVYDSSEKLFSPDLWRFAKTLIDYIKVYKEIPTQKVLIERANIRKQIALVNYVNDVFSILEKTNVDVSEHKHNLEKIKTRYTKKLIEQLKNSLSTDGDDQAIQKSISSISHALNGIKNVNSVKAYAQKSLKEGISDFRNRYMAKMQDSSFGLGLQTGLKAFDFITSGLRAQEFLIIGGPTGGGKSLMLGQCAINLWLNGNSIDDINTEGVVLKEGNDVIYFSLEMPWEDMQERILANLASLPQRSIRDATLSDDEKKRLATAIKFIENYPAQLTIVDIPRGATMESMELICNDIEANNGRKTKVVVIDYLSLMSYNNPNGGETQDWLIQGAISGQISEFGRVNDIITITAVQLTGEDPKNKGENMGTHRLSRSKMIGHNANFILMIEKRPNEQDLPDFIVHIVKSRRTEVGKFRLYKRLDCCQLLNDPPDGLFPMDEEDTSADFSNEIKE